jgi:phage terminase large subunit
MGVDVARFGDDQTVICFRRGRCGYAEDWITMRGMDTMQVAARVAEEYRTKRPEAVFVDEGGLGAGVVDRLKQLRVPVLGVNFGAKPDRLMIDGETKVRNKRAEMWALMRAWLKGGAIPDDHELAADLTGVEYGFDEHQAVQLEKKESMKKRGLASPDKGDALALTFAYPVGRVEEDEYENDRYAPTGAAGY